MFSKTSIYLITSLVILLIATNIWWAYENLDNAVTDKYQEAVIYGYRNALEEFVQLVPRLAEEKSKEEIVQILENVLGETSFEKGGFTNIGFLNYKFNEQGKLTQVEFPFQKLIPKNNLR